MVYDEERHSKELVLCIEKTHPFQVVLYSILFNFFNQRRDKVNHGLILLVTKHKPL